MPCDRQYAARLPSLRSGGGDTLTVVQVVDVEVERELEVRVTYDDDVTATFPVMALRLGCPCAGCRGKRDQGRAAYGGESISIVDAELHGNWGISLRWSDGHDTGIFAWTHLRTWWESGPESDPESDPESGPDSRWRVDGDSLP
jgi:DUF971 family protein